MVGREAELLKGFIILLSLPVLILPLAISGYIIVRGWGGMAEAGELLGQVTGSLLLAGMGCTLATPLSLGLAVWLCFQPARRGMSWLLRLQLLQAIPPLIYGLGGMVILVQGLHWGMSLLAGAIVLAVIVFPQMTLNYLAALRRIPKEWTESARCLGLGSGCIVLRVWLPGAWHGLVTGLLLSLARTLAETAPVLFTAAVFSGVVWPQSFLSPVTTLQTHVFYLAQEGVDEHAATMAWTAAAGLVLLVLSCSLIAQWLRARSLR